jgi:hypothetical protein
MDNGFEMPNGLGTQKVLSDNGSLESNGVDAQFDNYLAGGGPCAGATDFGNFQTLLLNP